LAGMANVALLHHGELHTFIGSHSVAAPLSGDGRKLFRGGG
jgi:hypothetical protein